MAATMTDFQSCIVQALRFCLSMYHLPAQLQNDSLPQSFNR
jgi:hypothetical protein